MPVESFDLVMRSAKFNDQRGCAWDVWWRDNQLGTMNAVTEDVVRQCDKGRV